MKLIDILNGSFDAKEWEQKGYQLPKYDLKAVKEKTYNRWMERVIRQSILSEEY